MILHAPSHLEITRAKTPVAPLCALAARRDQIKLVVAVVVNSFSFKHLHSHFGDPVLFVLLAQGRSRYFRIE